MKNYVKPNLIEIDTFSIMKHSGHGNPHDAGDWKPGDGQPPWAHGHHANEYRNQLWED